MKGPAERFFDIRVQAEQANALDRIESKLDEALELCRQSLGGAGGEARLRAFFSEEELDAAYDKIFDKK